MSGGLRWHPAGTKWVHGRPDAGSLIAHDFRVYRVLDVADRPRDLWEPEDREYVGRYKPEYQRKVEPYMIVLAPVEGGKGRHYYAGGRRRTVWHVYPDEHYPVCAKCQQPSPCRETVAAEAAAAAAERLDHYLTPGVCPACTEPISTRQKAARYEENTRFPGGPPVIFHAGRWACRQAAEQYAETLTVPTDRQVALGEDTP